MIHHGVVCKTERAQAIAWPAGCYYFEAVLYGTLAQEGYVYHQEAVYQWNPSPRGARLWPETQQGIDNSLKWLFPC